MEDSLTPYIIRQSDIISDDRMCIHLRHMKFRQYSFAQMIIHLWTYLQMETLVQILSEMDVAAEHIKPDSPLPWVCSSFS